MQTSTYRAPAGDGYGESEAGDKDRNGVAGEAADEKRKKRKKQRADLEE